MNTYSRNTIKNTKVVLQKQQNKISRGLAFILTLTILCNLFQVNIFAQEKVDAFEPVVTTKTTNIENTNNVNGEEPTGEEPASEEPASEVPTSEEATGEEPTGEEPTGEEPTGEEPTGEEPTGEEPASEVPTSEEPTGEEPTSEEPASEVPTSEQEENVAANEPILAIESSVLMQRTFSVASFSSPSEQYRITYNSNYPASSGLINAVYTDPIVYENNATANSSYLAQAGFVEPENYYFVGWNPAPNTGTAQYKEGINLGEIDVNWNLYAIYLPYKTMDWTIADSSYTSNYNAQSHTSLITWPTAKATAWEGDVIDGLTYTYSVNGGEFSSNKPTLVNAGNYIITVKASGTIYKEITTTVSVTINKAPLEISPNISGSYAFGSLSAIPHSIPAVNELNGPKSQSDESAINSAIAASASLFDAIDSENDIANDLKEALPGQYSVQVNSNVLASLQNNAAFQNYSLITDSSSFSITALNTLTVLAKALSTVYSATYHEAVSDITSSVDSATIEYSIDNSKFSTIIPQVKNAGSYEVEIRASAPGYNSVTIILTAVVEKRDATLNIAQHSKIAGAVDPTFAASFSGLQGSDEILYTLRRAAGEAVGDYIITADVVNNENYNVTVNDGLLKITSAPIVPVEPIIPGTTTEEEQTIITPDETETEQAQEEDTTIDEIENFELTDVELPFAGDIDQSEVNIGDVALPLSTGNGAWALLNLILTIVTTLVSLVLIIGYFNNKHKNSDEDESDKRNNKGFVRFTSVIIALIAIVLFLLTQNMRLEMVFVDSWSVVMIVLTVAQTIISVLAIKNKDNKKVVSE